MATISGKRFQITDGASTPTNLFPYTVTEAVYGLSTVIENAKTAVTSVLSAVTLNGVSKAGTTASFYAPTTAGTTGQILKATTSGAPVWTSAALGASNKPIYLNSSGVLTEGVSCLPLTGGTISNSTYYPLTINNSTSGATAVGIQFNGAGTRLGNIYVNGSDNTLHFYYGNSDNVIYHSGNSNKSDVAWTCSGLTAASGMIAGGTTSGSYIGSASGGLGDTYTGGLVLAYGNNPLYFRTNGSNRMIITGAGNVGIGTASPGYKLDVNGDVGLYANNTTGGAGIFIRNSASNNSAGYILFQSGSQNGFKIASVYTDWASRQDLVFYGSNNTTSPYTFTPTEAMRIKYNGNVGIGTTTPAYKLDVAGDVRLYTNLRILRTSITPNEYLNISMADSNAYYNGYDAADGWVNHAFQSNGTNIMVVYGNPNASYKVDIYGATRVQGTFVSTGDQVVSSDLTLKENLAPVTYSVSDIAKARAVEFDWKDGRGHSMGSIAQDWLGIAPALVHGEVGNMSLAYGQLALVNTILEARAIESLQVHESEQDKEIRELRERVARLEMENERLRMN